MGALREIVDAYCLDSISETYSGAVEITDLKEELGTKGHVLVVRGDRAYSNEIGLEGLPKDIANTKFWMYENLIKSPRIQEALKGHLGSSLFDGVGFSGLEALGYHANHVGRRAVAVMAHELIPDPKVHERYELEVLHGEGPAEEGYVKKQAEVISKRNDIIPLHQALYGARALAPVGNKVAEILEDVGIIPDTAFFCVASGSNLYGIGQKVRQRFPHCKTSVVEPENFRTIRPSLDFFRMEDVRSFARRELSDYSLDGWDKKHSGAFPLHVGKLNRYLLTLWAHSGNTGIDNLIGVPTRKVLRTQDSLKQLNPDYHWTQTTALTLTPAIELASRGKNVLVMAYGKYRKPRVRRLVLEEAGK